jgi:SAM-dependent methyltransferase
VPEPTGRRRELDLGAGRVVRAPGTLRADLSRDTRPDVVLDAAGPLPIRTASLSRIYCFDVLEHLDNLTAVLGELHRVLIPGGTVLITVPHFSCANAFTDPTHRHYFGLRSFDYFEPDHALRYYSTARFHVARRTLRFHGGVIDAIVRRLAARWPDWYEHRLAWIFPAWYLECELRAL